MGKAKNPAARLEMATENEADIKRSPTLQIAKRPLHHWNID